MTLEPNWDEILSDAENSPRAKLTEWLDDIDNYRSVVIIGIKRDSEDSDEVAFTSSGSSMEALGMVDWVRARLTENDS